MALCLFGFLAGTTVLGAETVGADPSTAWQLTPTAGLQNAKDSQGFEYPYLVMPTGGRWYLECPTEINQSNGQM
ncbi:MAG TPA: hypothetical protein VGL80_22245, partial [Pseudonocardiaceae bacterium]